MGISEIITKRKSVRTYASDIGESEKQDIIAFASSAFEPYGVDIEYRVLDAKEHGLSSPVLVGEKTYIAGKLKRAPHAEEAFGFSFENVVLHAQSLGVGTVWIAGTMDRKAFEKAMELSEGEVMPCMSPLGVPAEKRSIRDGVMRKTTGADDRLGLDKLVFDGAFGAPFDLSAAGELKDVFEAVRWAPSAVNKQPWRMIVKDGAVHFYEKKNKGFIDASGWDLQKIDVGIAMCHFYYAAEEKKIKTRFVISDPGIEVPQYTDYIASFILE